MTSTRWWHVAVVGTAVVLEAILILTGDDRHVLVGSIAGAVFLLGWFTLGWRCADDSPGMIVFIVIVVLYAGTVTFASPSLAIVQCIAFPLVWTRLSRIPAIIAGNLGIGIAVGAGFLLTYQSLLQTVVIEAVSLTFSIGLGLWITGIANQSDARRKLLDELQEAQAELALLNRDAGITSERDRLAREIHDTIAQDLTGIVLIAQRASRELAGGTSPAASLDLLEESARAALAETRSLVAATASPGLEGGMDAAIRRLAERFQRETGIAVEVFTDSTTAPSEIDRDTEVVLLRVAQEGLANVRKHSGATHVTITIDDRTLTVTDNGHGFDTSASSTGFGLSGMRDRLALVGGILEIASGTDGTTVRVTA